MPWNMFSELWNLQKAAREATLCLEAIYRVAASAFLRAAGFIAFISSIRFFASSRFGPFFA